jgi:hypothetical protein
MFKMTIQGFPLSVRRTAILTERAAWLV